jgi:hypothetical protein
MDRHSAEEAMTTRLARLTQKVQELRGERLTSLMGMLFDPEGLRSSFEHQGERKVPGVDGVRKAGYREGLEERIQELSRRLRSLGRLFTTSIPNLCGGLKLGAGWCNAPSPVLRGAGSNDWMVEIVWHRRETRR